MINLELEKIQRMLYKQEQQKKAENKRKYPFIFDHNPNKNLKNFFEFDKITSNPPSPSTSYFSDREIKNSLVDENKVNYDINSFIDNEQIPDLYTPLGKISGDNYNLIKKDHMQLDCLNQEEDDITYNNEKKIISKKRLRYFDLDFDLDIPEIIINKLPYSKRKKSKKKPYNNNNSKSNFISQKFCYICLSKDHLNKSECPKYKRCFKCLKYGHWAKNCQEIIKNKCENCHISAHRKEDCLKFREEIKYEDLFLEIKKKGLKCAFCEQKSHLICPFLTREKYILKYENEKYKQNNGNIKDFSKTLFCPFCAGNHLKKECPEINKKNKKSNFNEKNYLNMSSNFSSSNEKSFDSCDINNSFNKNSSNEDIEINCDKNDIDLDINKYDDKTYNIQKKDIKYNEQNNNIINVSFTQKSHNTKEINNIKEETNKAKEKLYFNKQNYYYRNKQYRKTQYQNKNSKKSGSLFAHYLAYKNRNRNRNSSF